jgi:hypothetical protein
MAAWPNRRDVQIPTSRRVRLSDTRCSITPEHRARSVEPFATVEQDLACHFAKRSEDSENGRGPKK